ncbi:conserved hypothetical protein [Ricinus communis]|uniref:Uncharacterized protein n=1 Tax=Ricinus communis TaxID=3988 RepID=B9RSA7_RICCO|nr:conserved hypothetical protein [Ricinus communis]
MSKHGSLPLLTSRVREGAVGALMEGLRISLLLVDLEKLHILMHLSLCLIEGNEDNLEGRKHIQLMNNITQGA